MIELQPLTTPDIPLLLSWIDSPAFLLQWAGPIFAYPLDQAQFEVHLKRLEEARELALKVVEQTTQQMIGYLELTGLDQANRLASVARVLVGPRQLRGQGIGTQMMQAILKIGFEELALHRIALLVFDFNVSAIRCYERVGFRTEGLLRETRRMGDEYWSVYVMSILEGEWRASLGTAGTEARSSSQGMSDQIQSEGIVVADGQSSGPSPH